MWGRAILWQDAQLPGVVTFAEWGLVLRAELKEARLESFTGARELSRGGRSGRVP